MLEPLVITHLDTYQVEHTVLHRHFHALPTPGLGTLVECRQNSRDQWIPEPVSPICAPVHRGGPSSDP